MRFFLKIFTAVVLVLILTLSATEYYILSSTLQQAAETQVQYGASKFLFLRYTLRSYIRGNAENTLSASVLEECCAQAQLLLESGEYIQVKSGGEIIYSTHPVQCSAQTSLTDVNWGMTEGQDSFYMWTGGSFEQNEVDVELVLLRDVTEIFDASDSLQQQFFRISLIILIISAALVFALVWFFTRPIRHLQRISGQMTEGNYEIRAQVKGGDELALLADAFNALADSMQGKILQLEQQVQQREDFIHNFAHELKTPLTSIIGYADVLYQKQLPPRQVRAAAEYIVNEGMRLEALSFKLLELSVLQRTDFILEETQAEELMLDAAKSITPTALNAGIKLDFSADKAWVRAELDLFKTMALNLLDNACKSGAKNISFTGALTPQGYKVTVQDNGRGIPADKLSRITEPFYMVDKSRSRSQHGAGLGLALCAHIARMHGTQLYYKSVEGVGTGVSFYLEVSEDET